MKCPACGAVLELVLGTDYSKTQEILAAKVSGADLTNEQLAAFSWKKSMKRPALSTILVNESSLAVPMIKLLYDRLRASASKNWKLGDVTYKLSRNDEGTEWLQRWQPVKD